MSEWGWGGEGRWWSRITEGWSERVDAKKREERRRGGEGGLGRGPKIGGKGSQVRANEAAEVTEGKGSAGVSGLIRSCTHSGSGEVKRGVSPRVTCKQYDSAFHFHRASPSAVIPPPAPITTPKKKKRKKRMKFCLCHVYVIQAIHRMCAEF